MAGLDDSVTDRLNLLQQKMVRKGSQRYLGKAPVGKTLVMDPQDDESPVDRSSQTPANEAETMTYFLSPSEFVQEFAEKLKEFYGENKPKPPFDKCTEMPCLKERVLIALYQSRYSFEEFKTKIENKYKTEWPYRFWFLNKLFLQEYVRESLSEKVLFHKLKKPLRKETFDPREITLKGETQWTQYYDPKTFVDDVTDYFRECDDKAKKADREKVRMQVLKSLQRRGSDADKFLEYIRTFKECWQFQHVEFVNSIFLEKYVNSQLSQRHTVAKTPMPTAETNSRPQTANAEKETRTKKLVDPTKFVDDVTDILQAKDEGAKRMDREDVRLLVLKSLKQKGYDGGKLLKYLRKKFPNYGFENMKFEFFNAKFNKYELRSWKRYVDSQVSQHETDVQPKRKRRRRRTAATLDDLKQEFHQLQEAKGSQEGTTDQHKKRINNLRSKVGRLDEEMCEEPFEWKSTRTSNMKHNEKCYLPCDAGKERINGDCKIPLGSSVYDTAKNKALTTNNALTIRYYTMMECIKSTYEAQYGRQLEDDTLHSILINTEDIQNNPVYAIYYDYYLKEVCNNHKLRGLVGETSLSCEDVRNVRDE